MDKEREERIKRLEQALKTAISNREYWIKRVKSAEEELNAVKENRTIHREKEK